MSDTTPEVEDRHLATLLALPEGERLMLCAQMFEAMRALFVAGLRRERPDITELEIRQQLFLGYYGDEFTPEQREQILAAIAGKWQTETGQTDDSASRPTVHP